MYVFTRARRAVNAHGWSPGDLITTRVIYVYLCWCACVPLGLPIFTLMCGFLPQHLHVCGFPCTYLACMPFTYGCNVEIAKWQEHTLALSKDTTYIHTYIHTYISVYRVRCVLDEGCVEVHTQDTQTGRGSTGPLVLNLSEWLIEDSYHTHERFSLRCTRDGEFFCLHVQMKAYVHICGGINVTATEDYVTCISLCWFL